MSRIKMDTQVHSCSRSKKTPYSVMTTAWRRTSPPRKVRKNSCTHKSRKCNTTAHCAVQHFSTCAGVETFVPLCIFELCTLMSHSIASDTIAMQAGGSRRGRVRGGVVGQVRLFIPRCALVTVAPVCTSLRLGCTCLLLVAPWWLHLAVPVYAWVRLGCSGVQYTWRYLSCMCCI